MPIETLQLDSKNERTHDDRNLEAIRNSLRHFGWREPIGARKGSNIVIRGNGTLLAARELAAASASDDPAVRATATLKPELPGRDYTGLQRGVDYEIEVDWALVPALRFDDDDERAAAWRVTHNRTAELAGWDVDALAETISEYSDFAWDDVGLNPTELAEIGIEWDSDLPTEDHDPNLGGGESADDDWIPPAPSEPITVVGEVIELGPHVLHCADCMDVLRSMADNSVDAIVSDPPYGLSPDGRARTWDEIEELRKRGGGPKGGFMGREWDAGVPGISWARECLRVLKPGGYMAAYSATRTIHRLMVAIEDAGFEIIDQDHWLHWEGMPHGMNVSLAIDKHLGLEREVVGHRPGFTAGGFGDVGAQLPRADDAVQVTKPASDLAAAWHDYHTRLRPCVEPIVIAQKPCEGTIVENILKWGTGALNIGACRHQPGDPLWPGPDTQLESRTIPASPSRGVGLAGSADGSLRGEFFYDADRGRFPANVFVCPKPSSRERNEGTEELPQLATGMLSGAERAIATGDPARGLAARFMAAPRGNIHPTVKPVRGMRRSLLMLLPPGGGVVLEPFGGSGTTFVAGARIPGCRVIGAEREPAYCDIIRARVEHALAQLGE
ncbi:MAG: hypothetical protein M0R28_18185 [Pigmentiphaga sp.]|nr:hypothetical protein [Pigmentiphaga sp.]